MSRVLILGQRAKTRGPWQIKCQRCDSMIELTIDCIKSSRNGEWWDCPACGSSHDYQTVTNSPRRT